MKYLPSSKDCFDVIVSSRWYMQVIIPEIDCWIRNDTVYHVFEFSRIARCEDVDHCPTSFTGESSWFVIIMVVVSETDPELLEQFLASEMGSSSITQRVWQKGNGGGRNFGFAPSHNPCLRRERSCAIDKVVNENKKKLHRILVIHPFASLNACSSWNFRFLVRASSISWFIFRLLCLFFEMMRRCPTINSCLLPQPQIEVTLFSLSFSHSEGHRVGLFLLFCRRNVLGLIAKPSLFRQIKIFVGLFFFPLFLSTFLLLFWNFKEL